MTFTVLSDNKSNHKNSTNVRWSHYIIVREEWCSDKLIKWIWMMDLLACGEKWDGYNVARPGNDKHIHVMSTCSKDRVGKAVHDFPRIATTPVG